MIKFRNLLKHIRSVFQIRRHFENSVMIVLLRMGVVKVPYFLYRIRNAARNYSMLGRPTTTSCADLFVLREVLVDEAYSQILPLLTKNIRFVDIGANIGSFTIWMHKTLGVREAFCFEPEPDSFRLLNFNISANNCSSAKLFEMAMGGEARTIKIQLKKDSPGGTNIYGDGGDASEGKAVAVAAFEAWLRGVEGNFDLIKIDCEGAEWEILRKTDPKCFDRFRVVVAEVHADPEKQQQVSEFRSMLENLGYKTIRWDNKAHGLYIGSRQANP